MVVNGTFFELFIGIIRPSASAPPFGRIVRPKDQPIAFLYACTCYRVTVGTFKFCRITCLFTFTGGIRLIPDFSPSRAALIVITMTAGTALLMWMGELITQRGIGNGMSLLIFISIISQIPSQLTILWTNSDAYQAIVIYAVMIAAIFLPAASLVDEREKRTLDAVLVTPTRMSDVLVGKGTFAVVLAVILGFVTLALHPEALCRRRRRCRWTEGC